MRTRPLVVRFQLHRRPELAERGHPMAGVHRPCSLRIGIGYTKILPYWLPQAESKSIPMNPWPLDSLPGSLTLDGNLTSPLMGRSQHRAPERPP